MYLGLDRDSGRDDRATPATRADAEQALRDLASGTSDVGMSGFLSKEDRDAEGTCENGCPPGVCLGEVFDAAITEALAKGLKPDAPEFGEILERTFREQNPDSNVKISFLGAHKVGSPMPDELKEKLDSIMDPFPGFPFSEAELADLVRTMPPMPSLFDGFKPALASSALVPLPPLFGSPSNPTIGGDNHELPGLDELLKRIFETPKGERLEATVEETEADEFEEERRGVVQDLTAAALNLSEQLYEPAAEDTAAALRDIAALARDTYEI
jgi:hypothetical protein